MVRLILPVAATLLVLIAVRWSQPDALRVDGFWPLAAVAVVTALGSALTLGLSRVAFSRTAPWIRGFLSTAVAFVLLAAFTDEPGPAAVVGGILVTLAVLFSLLRGGGERAAGGAVPAGHPRRGPARGAVRGAGGLVPRRRRGGAGRAVGGPVARRAAGRPRRGRHPHRGHDPGVDQAMARLRDAGDRGRPRAGRVRRDRAPCRDRRPGRRRAPADDGLRRRARRPVGPAAGPDPRQAPPVPRPPHPRPGAGRLRDRDTAAGAARLRRLRRRRAPVGPRDRPAGARPRRAPGPGERPVRRAGRRHRPARLRRGRLPDPDLGAGDRPPGAGRRPAGAVGRPGAVHRAGGRSDPARRRVRRRHRPAVGPGRRATGPPPGRPAGPASTPSARSPSTA